MVGCVVIVFGILLLIIKKEDYLCPDCNAIQEMQTCNFVLCCCVCDFCYDVKYLHAIGSLLVCQHCRVPCVKCGWKSTIDDVVMYNGEAYCFDCGCKKKFSRLYPSYCAKCNVHVCVEYARAGPNKEYLCPPCHDYMLRQTKE